MQMEMKLMISNVIFVCSCYLIHMNAQSAINLLVGVVNKNGLTKIGHALAVARDQTIEGLIENCKLI